MRTFSSPMRLAAAALAALALGACARQDRMVTGSVIPTDVRARHPIVMTNAPQTLDVFVGGSAALDRRQTLDVEEFARSYRESGTGLVQILTPRGSGSDAQAQRVAAAVRAKLASLGVGGVETAPYSVADGRLAAPVRLVYQGLAAKGASRCGEWPDDLGASGAKAGWDNRPYYNFGCAYQQNLAAQVADPRDLVRPRKLDPADTTMRLRAIGAVREGTNPGTQWSSPNYIGELQP